MARLAVFGPGRRRGGPRSGALRPVACHALRSCLHRVACGDGRDPRPGRCVHWIGGCRVLRADAPLDRRALPGRCRTPRLDGALRAGALRRRSRAFLGRSRGGLAVRSFEHPSPARWLFAPLLTLAEAARGTVLTGFPWAFPGHALIDTPWLLLSAVTGAHGLDVAGGRDRRRFGPFAFLRPTRLADRRGGAGALFCPLRCPASPPRRRRPTRRSYADPTQRAAAPEMAAGHDPRLLAAGPGPDRARPDPELGAPDLVVWPETSLPVLLDRSDAARVQLGVASAGAPVLIGAQRVEGLPRATPSRWSMGAARCDRL
jgi:hypothetical protein